VGQPTLFVGRIRQRGLTNEAGRVWTCLKRLDGRAIAFVGIQIRSHLAHKLGQFVSIKVNTRIGGGGDAATAAPLKFREQCHGAASFLKESAATIPGSRTKNVLKPGNWQGDG